MGLPGSPLRPAAFICKVPRREPEVHTGLRPAERQPTKGVRLPSAAAVDIAVPNARFRPLREAFGTKDVIVASSEVIKLMKWLDVEE